MPLSSSDFLCPDRRTPTVLLVEDDPSSGQILSEVLTKMPVDVTLSHTAIEGFRVGRSKHWDAVVIDLRSPGDSGLDLCRRLIDNDSSVPIILIAQSRESLQYLLGFELGAADCLYRPYDPRELAFRLRSVLRRGQKSRSPTSPRAEIGSSLVCDGLVIDAKSRITLLDGKTVDLTPQEFDLLHFMAVHSGVVYSRVELLEKVWHGAYGGSDHTVDSHINRIRQKLGESSKSPRFIHTVWARGYRFETGGPIPMR
jgi:two-component system, OmpR family, response regulator